MVSASRSARSCVVREDFASKTSTGACRRSPNRCWTRRTGVASIAGSYIAYRPPATPDGFPVEDGRLDGDQMHVPDLDADPVFGEDGFVVERPWLQCQADDPMWNNYTFVAALDPVALADGFDGTVGARIEDVQTTTHHGRPSWEAIVHPSAGYEPRCHCCSLLLAPQSFGGVGGVPAGLRWPDAHWVRLDVQTGVCVVAEQLGGSRAGTGHEIVIEAVDEPMPDDLFTARPGNTWRKTWGMRASRR